MSLNRKRLGSLLAAVLLCAGALLLPSAAPRAERSGETTAFAKGEALTGSGYVSVAKAGDRELFADPATGGVYLTDSALGQTLYSFPQAQEEDTLASGYNLFSMNSAFIIQYINAKKVTTETNAVVASVRKGGLTANRTQDGVLFTYVMPEIGITIPVACVLRDGALEVSILVDQIKEEGEFQLLECALMPYMGSAGPQDTGYVLAPDGSGALLDFYPNSPSQSDFLYKKAVYGRDMMNSVTSQNNKSEDILLPVFAVKTQRRAMLGIVTEGDALTSLEIFAKGSKTLHAAIHPVMTYRGTYTRTLFDDSWDKRKVVIVAENAAAIPVYTVRYALLGDTDYAGLAEQTAGWYRAQAKEGARERDTSASLTVNFLGAVHKPASVLGVPTETLYVDTTYAQARSIAKKLLDGGVDSLHAVYRGMFAGGLYDKMPVKAKTEGKLGSKKELTALRELLESCGGGFFPAADLSAIYTSGNGLSRDRDASRDFAGGVKEIVAFSPITFAPEEDGLSYTVLTPRKQPEIYERFTASLLERGLTAFADSGTGRLSSNNQRTLFGETRFVDRQNAKTLQQQAIAAASAKLDAYLVDKAAGYLLPYATHVGDAPSVSSRDNAFTREIPFYSLVASRFAQLSASPINFVDDADLYLLRCVEYGLLPSAYISGGDTSKLWDTDANWLYAAGAGTWVPALVSLYENNREALRLVGSSALVKHEPVKAGVYKSGYASGETVYVNYTDEAVTVDGQTVPAKSYRIGGAV